jgi:hypothetical protein
MEVLAHPNQSLSSMHAGDENNNPAPLYAVDMAVCISNLETKKNRFLP